MVSGFNHDFVYKGLKFHLQAEDCGSKAARIVTHLFKDGSIIASRKTSYADILTVDNLDKVVQELMKDQARDVLRSLRSGDYDPIIYGEGQKGQLVREKAVLKGETPHLPQSVEVPPAEGLEEKPDSQIDLFSVVTDDSDPLEAFGLSEKLAAPWWQDDSEEPEEEEGTPIEGGLQLAAPWWDEEDGDGGNAQEESSPAEEAPPSTGGLRLASPWWEQEEGREKHETPQDKKEKLKIDRPWWKKK